MSGVTVCKSTSSPVAAVVIILGGQRALAVIYSTCLGSNEAAHPQRRLNKVHLLTQRLENSTKGVGPKKQRAGKPTAEQTESERREK